MTSLTEYGCRACGFACDVLTHNGESVAMAPPGFEDQFWEDRCIACGSSEVYKVVNVPTAIDCGDVGGVGKVYPYFDRGLNTFIRNKRHRAEVCKQKGVVPIDGDIDIERIASQQVAQEQAALQAWEDDKRMYEEHPDFREFREARDKGVFDDMVKETFTKRQPWRKKMPKGMEAKK